MCYHFGKEQYSTLAFIAILWRDLTQYRDKILTSVYVLAQVQEVENLSAQLFYDHLQHHKVFYKRYFIISCQTDRVDGADGLQWTAVWKNTGISYHYHSISDWHGFGIEVDNNLPNTFLCPIK